MDIICIGRGNCTMGMVTHDAAGNVTSRAEAKWEPDEKGGSVAIWTMDAETKEVTGPALCFGDWDAAGYLGKVLELLKPDRKINVPDLKAIIPAAERDGADICQYCKDQCSYQCRDCIVREWKES